jgi:hypothetical protein
MQVQVYALQKQAGLLDHWKLGLIIANLLGQLQFASHPILHPASIPADSFRAK